MVNLKKKDMELVENISYSIYMVLNNFGCDAYEEG
jgi:hypothetical protein